MGGGKSKCKVLTYLFQILSVIHYTLCVSLHKHVSVQQETHVYTENHPETLLVTLLVLYR